MSFLANLPLFLVTVLYFRGRLFESLKITDYTTGFLTGRPLVFRTIIVVLIVLIAVCSSVVIMMQKSPARKDPRPKVGGIGFVIGGLFVLGAFLNLLHTFRYGGFLGFDLLILLSGAGWIIYAVTGLRGQNIEKVALVLVLAGAVSFCLSSVLTEVSTVSNTIYTTRNLSRIMMLLFLISFFRTAYSSNDLSDMLLYRSSFLNVVFSLGGLSALTLGILSKQGVDAPSLVYDLGIIMTGLFSFITALRLASKQFSGLRVNDKELVRRSADYSTGEIVSGDTRQTTLSRRFNTDEIKRETEAADATGFLGITPDELKARANRNRVQRRVVVPDSGSIEIKPQTHAEQPVKAVEHPVKRAEQATIVVEQPVKKAEQAAGDVERNVRTIETRTAASAERRTTSWKERFRQENERALREKGIERKPKPKAQTQVKKEVMVKNEAPVKKEAPAARQTTAAASPRKQNVFSASSGTAGTQKKVTEKKVFVADDSDMPKRRTNVKKKVFTADDE